MGGPDEGRQTLKTLLALNGAARGAQGATTRQAQRARAAQRRRGPQGGAAPPARLAGLPGGGLAPDGDHADAPDAPAARALEVLDDAKVRHAAGPLVEEPRVVRGDPHDARLREAGDPL